jgi:myo-inositol-1(or 4)-monophosphatase
MSDDQLIDDLLALAVSAAERVGRFLLEERPRDLEVAATKSSPTDVVTAMDTAAERMLDDLLRADRPDDAFLGEEGTSVAAGRSSPARVRWVVDPIDGTVNYLYDIPAWAVSVAAEVDGQVVVGVVVNPSVGETFAAARGRGATCNGRPLAASTLTALDSALIGTGFGYDAGVRADQAAVVAALLPRVRDVRRMGAASLDLCSVAAGRLDGYYERGLQEWDHAAGGLIAVEAGARVGGRGDEPAGSSLVVAAGSGLFDPLQAALRSAGG